MYMFSPDWFLNHTTDERLIKLATDTLFLLPCSALRTKVSTDPERYQCLKGILPDTHAPPLHGTPLAGMLARIFSHMRTT